MVLIPVAVGITLWRNSEWSLELRSFRELRYVEVDGFIAPFFLIAAFPTMELVKNLVIRFKICEHVYAQLFVVLTAIAFSIGFSFSAFRQTNLAGKLVAGVTLLVCGAIILLGLGVLATMH